MRFVWVLAVSIFFQNTRAAVLDPSFNPGSGANGIVEQVLPLSNGQYLICGNFTAFNGRPKAYMARLNNDGSVDESFTGTASYWVRHMAVQPWDGKIVAGGFFKGAQGQSVGLIARFNSNGSLDTSFNTGTGCTDSLGVAIDGNADPFVFWTEVLPDGKILATGNFRNYNGASSTGIVRINPDGSRDTSFNVGGGLDSWGRSITQLPNNQILLTGWFQSYRGMGFNRLVKINYDGSPDTSFNPYFGDRTAIYSAVAVENGKYVVCGHSLNYEGLFTRELERLNPDGSVDGSFPGYSNEKTESVVRQSDGKLIFGGYFNVLNGARRTMVGRLNADGSLDNTWSAEIDNYVWTVALDRDGKAMISGGFYTVDGISRNGVARLLTGATGGNPPPPPPPPAAPVLGATANSTSQITLTWSDSATDRNGYSLERKTGAGGTYAWLANLGAGARSYVNTGLAGGTQYYYRLRATTTSGGAVYSNEANATTSSPPPPPTGGTASATWIGADTTTRGNWKGAYGADGANIFGDGGNFPAYARVTPINKSDWVWQYSTADTRALQKVTSADRLAACWYSSTGYSIDVAITDGQQHRMSLYLLDWDGMGRIEHVQLVDGDTGAVLNAQRVFGFSGGVYVTWDISGHVKINITPESGNAVVSGIFFGGSSGTTQQTVATPTISPNGGAYTSAQTVTFGTATAGAEIRYTLDGSEPTGSSALYSGPFTVSASSTVKAKGFKSGMLASGTASATFTISTGGGGGGTGANFVFVGADNTTRGNWRGVYGSDGYYVLPGFVKGATYAQVTPTGKSDWTWNYTTADTRALQTPDGASRTAGCWYSSGAETIDVRFTDGATHRVALYLCDWDSASRSETVELLNGDTGAVVNTQSVSAFSGGRYLVWDVKGHFQVRVTRTAGPNAIVNGLFFSPAAQQL